MRVKLLISIKISVMKKISLILMLLVAISAISLAQDTQRGQRLESEKIAFFTSKLNLTPDEAREFWPVYNEYTKKRGELNKEKNELLKSINKDLSEQALEDAGDKIIDKDLKQAELAKNYHKEFKKILSANKVLRLYQVENQFRRVLLEQLRDRRSDTQQANRRRQQLR